MFAQYMQIVATSLAAGKWSPWLAGLLKEAEVGEESVLKAVAAMQRAFDIGVAGSLADRLEPRAMQANEALKEAGFNDLPQAVQYAVLGRLGEVVFAAAFFGRRMTSPVSGTPTQHLHVWTLAETIRRLIEHRGSGSLPPEIQVKIGDEALKAAYDDLRRLTEQQAVKVDRLIRAERIAVKAAERLQAELDELKAREGTQSRVVHSVDAPCSGVNPSLWELLKLAVWAWWSFKKKGK